MTLKTLFFATGALVTMASPALAQQTAQVDIGGNAAAACSASGSFITIALGNLADGVSGLNPAAVNTKTASNTTALYCNGVNSTLALTASNLTSAAPLPSGAAAAGFANQVTFRATASLLAAGYSSDPIVATDLSDATSSAGTPDVIGLLNAPAGSLLITLTQAALPGTATKLMADPAYTGSVTLTISAAI
jgi:hypothetical protein